MRPAISIGVAIASVFPQPGLPARKASGWLGCASGTSPNSRPRPTISREEERSRGTTKCAMGLTYAGAALGSADANAAKVQPMLAFGMVSQNARTAPGTVSGLAPPRHGRSRIPVALVPIHTADQLGRRRQRAFLAGGNMRERSGWSRG